MEENGSKLNSWHHVIIALLINDHGDIGMFHLLVLKEIQPSASGYNFPFRSFTDVGHT